MLCLAYLLLVGLAPVLSAPQDIASDASDASSPTAAPVAPAPTAAPVAPKPTEMPKYVRADKNQDTREKGHNIGDVYLDCQEKIKTCREMAADPKTAPEGEQCWKKLPDRFTNCNKAAKGTYDCSGAMGSTLLNAKQIQINATEFPPVLGYPGPYDGSDEDKCRYLCQTMDKNDCKGWSFGRFQNGDKDKKHCYLYNRIGSTNTDPNGKAQNMVFAPRVAKRNKN